jgi:hypothetical protein
LVYFVRLMEDFTIRLTVFIYRERLLFALHFRCAFRRASEPGLPYDAHASSAADLR